MEKYMRYAFLVSAVYGAVCTLNVSAFELLQGDKKQVDYEKWICEKYDIEKDDFTPHVLPKGLSRGGSGDEYITLFKKETVAFSEYNGDVIHLDWLAYRLQDNNKEIGDIANIAINFLPLDCAKFVAGYALAPYTIKNLLRFKLKYIVEQHSIEITPNDTTQFFWKYNTVSVNGIEVNVPAQWNHGKQHESWKDIAEQTGVQKWYDSPKVEYGNVKNGAFYAWFLVNIVYPTNHLEAFKAISKYKKE